MVTTRSGIHPEKLPSTERASFSRITSKLSSLSVEVLESARLTCCWMTQGMDSSEWHNDTSQNIYWSSTWMATKLCKQTFKNPWATQTCSCRKYGLCCVQACSGCHGESQSESMEKINPNYKMTAIVAVATTLTETFLIFLNSLSFIFQFIPDEPRIQLVKCL